MSDVLMTRSSLARIFAAAGVVAFAACGGADDGGPVGPSPRLTVEVTPVVASHLERSLDVTLTARRGGLRLADSSVTWSAEPPTAVQFVGPASATLLEAGPVTFRARSDGLQAEKDIEVAVPPSIVFDLREAERGRNVWIAALDGRDPRRLTDEATDDTDPTVGGGRIVFTSTRFGRSELMAMALDGSGLARLTESEADEIEPALSRDGARLAFAGAGFGDSFQVWTADPDGSNAVRATDGLGFEGAIEGSPSWAPGGDRLALMSTARGDADVWTVPISLDGAEAVAADTGVEVEPAWHPTDEQLVYAAVVDGDTELFLLDLSAETVTRLTTRPGTDGQPAWLPDGRIVYTAWTDGEPKLRWLDPADPELVQEIPITEGERPQNPHGIYE